MSEDQSSAARGPEAANNPSGRAVDLWVGKTPDAAIPPRVKLRIWNREGGRCSLTGRKIMPGEPFDYEHRIALCNGGRHAEDNIVLALRGKVHQAKTADDVAIKAKTDRIAKKHLGIWPKGQKIASRGFDKRWAR